MIGAAGTGQQGPDPGSREVQLVRRAGMSMNDPLGDMLTRIRNAQMRKKRARSRPPGSRLRANVLDVSGAGRVHPWLYVDRPWQRPDRVRHRAEVFRRRSGHQADRACVEAGSPRGMRPSTPCLAWPMASASRSFRRPRASWPNHAARENNVGGEVLCKVF